MLVINPNHPRGHWPLGRFIEVFPGRDGHVRIPNVLLGQNVLPSAVVSIVLRNTIFRKAPPSVVSGYDKRSINLNSFISCIG